MPQAELDIAIDAEHLLATSELAHLVTHAYPRCGDRSADRVEPVVLGQQPGEDIAQRHQARIWQAVIIWAERGVALAGQVEHVDDLGILPAQPVEVDVEIVFPVVALVDHHDDWGIWCSAGNGVQPCMDDVA